MSEVDTSNEMIQLLQKYYDNLKSIDGIYAVYILDFENQKKEYKILVENYDKQKSFKILKQLSPLFKDEDFDMFVGDFSDRIFLNRTSKKYILMIISNKDVALGRILTLTKSIRG